MKKYKSKLSIAFSVFFVLLMSVSYFLFSPSLILKVSADNFPLNRLWSQRFNDLVVDISTSNSDEIIFIRTNKSLYALQSNTGDILWSFPLSKQIDHSPAVNFGTKVYVTDSEALLALDMENGRVRWSQPLPETSGRVVDVSNSIVLINEVGADIRAYDVKSGSFLWNISGGRGFIQAFIDENLIYIPDYGVKAIDIKNGKDVWQYGTDVKYPSDYYNGVIYSAGNRVVAFDVRNQTELWDMVLPIVGLQRLKLDNDFLFVMDEKNIYLIKKSNGTLAWQVGMSHPMNPVIIGDVVYVMDGFGRVIQVFNLSTGKEVGHIRVSLPHLLVVENQDMYSSADILLFSSGKYLFAYK